MSDELIERYDGFKYILCCALLRASTDSAFAQTLFVRYGNHGCVRSVAVAMYTLAGGRTMQDYTVFVDRTADELQPDASPSFQIAICPFNLGVSAMAVKKKIPNGSGLGY